MRLQPDDVRRLESGMAALTAQVRDAAPHATTHLEEQSDGYFCWSWRLDGRASRELFIEQAGREVPPFVLRVGVYFGDVVQATSRPAALEIAFDALVNARPGLQGIGASLTFTPGAATRDDRRFGWSDDDLRAWLTDDSANRDLVWLWDLQNGLPTQADVELAVSQFLPVWKAWNDLGRE